MRVDLNIVRRTGRSDGTVPLKFPGGWRFKPPADGAFVNESIPDGVVSECIGLIGKAATQRDRQEALEHFKG